MKDKASNHRLSCHVLRGLLFVSALLCHQLFASADNSLQQALDKLMPSANVTEFDLSQYPSTLTETLYIRGGINVRFVNGTLERDKSITIKPLVEIMENSRLELSTSARLAGYRGEFASVIALLSSGELVIKGGEIDGSLGDVYSYYPWDPYQRYYNPIASSVAITSESGSSLIIESGTLTGDVTIASPSGASFIIKSGTLTGDVVNKGENDVRIYGGTVKGIVSTQQTDILVGGEANIDQITLENNTRVGILSPVVNDITIKDVASGEAAIYGHGYQLTPSDIANIWFMDDYKPQLSGNTVIATEWGSERYMWQNNPGHLAYMSEHNQEITEVVSIAGKVNGADIGMIRKLGQMALKTVDLSNAKLVDGGSYYSYYVPGFPGGHSVYYYAKKDTISYLMFGNMNVIESIHLPNGVVSIEDNAFINCNNLKQIQGLDFVRGISGSAFNGCTSLTDFNLDNNTYLVNENGVIFDKEKTKVHTTLPAIVSGGYTLPNTVQEINPYAFYGCKGLYEVQLPESVAKLADYSFSSCSLTNITIPERLTELGYGAFAYNPITEIHCNNNIPPAIQPFTTEQGLLPVYYGGGTPKGSFQGVDTLTCKVYVPEGSIEAYKSAPGWSSFQNYVGQISTVDDLQAKLDEIAAKGEWDTVELSAEGVLVDKTLYVRNGCHADLTGGPLRISPNILNNYCVYINKKDYLGLKDITIDLMGNDFQCNDGIFYSQGKLFVSNVDFINVPTNTMNGAKCVFYLASGSEFDYYIANLQANYLRTIIAENNTAIDIHSGKLESTLVPTIDGQGNVMLWHSTVSGGGKGVSIINAHTFHTHEGGQSIIDLEGGSTYITADSLSLWFDYDWNYRGHGKKIVIRKHAYVSGAAQIPTLYLSTNASITPLDVFTEYTLDGDWSTFTLGRTIIDNLAIRDDFLKMTFLNMPADREAYYDELGWRVYLRKKTEDGIEDIGQPKSDNYNSVYDMQGRRMGNSDCGRGLRLQRMSDGTVRKTMKH